MDISLCFGKKDTNRKKTDNNDDGSYHRIQMQMTQHHRMTEKPQSDTGNVMYKIYLNNTLFINKNNKNIDTWEMYENINSNAVSSSIRDKYITTEIKIAYVCRPA